MISDQPAPGGSSPLTRGTQRRRKEAVGILRFIPAYAGNTYAFLCGLRPHPVHPRLRGEHTTSASNDSGHGGSSPLTRGTREILHDGGLVWRFIPAYAGNTSTLSSQVKDITVHPRLRGEHVVWIHWYAEYLRFIPAYAGNTDPAAYKHTLAAVHPRLRGEHRSFCGVASLAVGSSPLTRGTQRRGRHYAHPARFIPAYAGNTWQGSLRSGRAPVHPRLRGEHTKPKQLIQNSFFPHQKSTNVFRGEHPPGCHPDRPLI